VGHRAFLIPEKLNLRIRHRQKKFRVRAKLANQWSSVNQKRSAWRISIEAQKPPLIPVVAVT
jgi:hypothetical protein